MVDAVLHAADNIPMSVRARIWEHPPVGEPGEAADK